LVDGVDPHKIQSRLEELRSSVRDCVAAMPPHWEFIQSGQTRGNMLGAR